MYIDIDNEQNNYTHTINTSQLANINIFTCFTFVWHHPEIGNSNDKNQPFWKPCAFEKIFVFGGGSQKLKWYRKKYPLQSRLNAKKEQVNSN